MRSVICVAGPLTGSTFIHLAGVKGIELKRWTPTHLFGIVMGIWYKLTHDIPLLRNVYDLRMPQWRNHRELAKIVSVDHPLMTSLDGGERRC